MTAADFPQVGDTAVDLRTNGRPNGVPHRIGNTVIVKRITQTMVITSDGERYSRERLRPISEGRYSDRQLVPASDPRVLVVKGRRSLDELARTADNLAKLDHKAPEDIFAALAQIAMAAAVARRAFLEITADASRAEQESGR